MPINNGKNAGIVYTNDDTIFSFTNTPITQNDKKLSFYKNFQDEQPQFIIDPKPYNNYRCLHYNCFSPSQVINLQNHIVVFKNQNLYMPLFQTINLTTFEKNNIITICFWSVLKNGVNLLKDVETLDYKPETYGKISQDQSQVYFYDYLKILRFKQNQLQNFQLDDKYQNIFCSVKLNNRQYFISKQNEQQRIPEQILMIEQQPKIIDCQQDIYPVLDFTVDNGNGSGIKQHQHIPYVDGTSYAFAVFHPGTSMPQLPWTT